MKLAHQKQQKTPKTQKVAAKKATKKVAHKTARRSIVTTASTAAPATTVVGGASPLNALKLKKVKKSFADAIEQQTAEAMANLPTTITQAERTNMLTQMQIHFARKYLVRRGLYMEDMYEDYAHTRACVHMLPVDVRKDRLRRWLRALDLDLKFKELPQEMQIYDPFVSYGLDDALIKYNVFLCEDVNYV